MNIIPAFLNQGELANSKKAGFKLNMTEGTQSLTHMRAHPHTCFL